MDKCSFYRHSFQNAWKNMKKGEKIILTLLKPSLNPKKGRFFRFSKKKYVFSNILHASWCEKKNVKSKVVELSLT